MSNSSEDSTILLMCLGQELGRSGACETSVIELQRVFAPFGSLRKIIIFSRKFVLKAFVEFGRIEDARRAREVLNERVVVGLGRARVYFSALQQLANSNRYLESWDYKSGVVDADLSPGKDERLTCASSVDSGSTEPCDLSLSCASDSLDRQTLSPVVLISNVDGVFASARELLNLFSCFGYVVKLLFMRNLRKALVEYRLPIQAEHAVSAINSAAFAGLCIKANFSKYRSIDLRKNNKSGNSQQFNEVIVLSPAQNRCAEAEVPSEGITHTVTVSCPRHAGLQHVDLYLLVQDTVLPSQVKFVSGDESVLQLRFEFSETEEAALAVAKLHGTFLKGSLISASFY